MAVFLPPGVFSTLTRLLCIPESTVHKIVKCSFKNINLTAGEMGQWVGARAKRAEDLSWIPSVYVERKAWLCLPVMPA